MKSSFRNGGAKSLTSGLIPDLSDALLDNRVKLNGPVRRASVTEPRFSLCTDRADQLAISAFEKERFDSQQYIKRLKVISP